MVPELEKPRVTEILVRMDCNGCVQKIKKALHGINGIYDLYIDFPQQKLTVVGWADPERILKAIRKTRKIATICSHTELNNPPEPPTEPALDAADAPPAELTPPEATPTELSKDSPPPKNPPPDIAAQKHVVTECDGPKDVEEVHVIHHHTLDYGYGYSGQHGQGYWSNHSSSPWSQPESKPYAPVYLSHNYNTYRPSPYISEYEYPGSSPPRQTDYNKMEPYSEEYHSRGNSNGNNITSIFSDENPNACTIV